MPPVERIAAVAIAIVGAGFLLLFIVLSTVECWREFANDRRRRRRRGYVHPTEDGR